MTLQTKSIAFGKTGLKARSGTTSFNLAFTIVELLIVISIIAVLAAIFGDPRVRMRQKARRISCASNLKEIGRAYSVRFPPMLSIAEGGWKEFLVQTNQGVHCWTNYALIANELNRNPKAVICPADERNPASNFIVKGTSEDKGNADFKNNSRVSYFVGIGTNDFSMSSILGGDRNLGPGIAPGREYGFSPADGHGNDVIIQVGAGAQPVSWSRRMHSKGVEGGAGNILLADGSVAQISSGMFRSNYQQQAIEPFRLIYP